MGDRSANQLLAELTAHLSNSCLSNPNSHFPTKFQQNPQNMMDPVGVRCVDEGSLEAAEHDGSIGGSPVEIGAAI